MANLTQTLKYLDKVRLYQNIKRLTELLDEAANDDTISNEEYEKVYVAVLNKLRGL